MVAATLPQGGSPQGRHTMPATLAEAHEVLWRQRPARDADPREWVRHHRYGAELYSQVSKIDLRHHHEAVQCAGLELRKARGIEERLDPNLVSGDDR